MARLPHRQLRVPADLDAAIKSFANEACEGNYSLALRRLVRRGLAAYGIDVPVTTVAKPNS